MAQLTDQEKTLIQEAQFFVYHVVFKENIFSPDHDVTCFTFPQLISAFREGFNYIDRYGEINHYAMRKMEVLKIYRHGLPGFVKIEEVPELKLVLSYPYPNV